MDELLQLEKELSFETFTNDMAFEFASNVLEIVKKENLGPIRIRVLYNDDIVYQYMMEGKKGDVWLNRKQLTVLESEHSSLYAARHSEDYKYMIDNENYALCGGGFPLIVNDEVCGVFLISGLADIDDHRLIVESLRKMK